MLRAILRFFGRLIVSYIEKPVQNYRAYQLLPLADLEATLQWRCVAGRRQSAHLHRH